MNPHPIIFQLQFRTLLEPTLLLIFIVLVLLIIQLKLIERNNAPLRIKQNFIYIEPLSSFFRQTYNIDNIKVDWHDYKFIEAEKHRNGPGENGSAYEKLEDDEIELSERIFDENGYNGLISDKISVNRSVVDLRHPNCKRMRYWKELPSVSVIIPFYNEHLSVLLRTVHR